MMEQTKRCSKCGEIKLSSEFYRDKKGKDGKHSQCKACMNARNKAKYERYTEINKGREIDQSKTKVCTKCGVEKSFKDFYNENRNKDGKSSKCKACMQEEYRLKNPKEEYFIDDKPAKHCKKCGELKVLTDFPVAIKSQGWYRGVCKECKRKEYAEKHPPKKPKAKEGHKICNKCNKEKPLDEFGLSNRIKDGHNGTCKECINSREQKRKPKAKEGHKICNKCGKEKPFKDFRKNNSCKYGVEGTCKKCKNKMAKEKAEKNRIKVDKKVCRKCKTEKPIEEFNRSSHSIDGHRAECRECSKKMKRNWNKYNPDKVKEYNKQWRAENPEHVKQYASDYAQSHKTERLVLEQKRRAMKMELPHDLTNEQWNQILNDFNNECALNREGKVNLEHFLPISIGHGGTTLGNVYPLEHKINCSKNDKNPLEWMKELTEKEQENFNRVIVYLAKQNHMQVNEFKDYINWCFNNPRTLEEVIEDNKAGITSKDLFCKSLGE